MHTKQFKEELDRVREEAKGALVDFINDWPHCPDIRRAHRYNKVVVTAVNTKLLDWVFVSLEAQFYVDMKDLEWLMAKKSVKPEILSWYTDGESIRVHIQIKHTYNATSGDFISR